MKINNKKKNDINQVLIQYQADAPKLSYFKNTFLNNLGIEKNRPWVDYLQSLGTILVKMNNADQRFFFSFHDWTLLLVVSYQDSVNWNAYFFYFNIFQHNHVNLAFKSFYSIRNKKNNDVLMWALGMYFISIVRFWKGE